MKISKTVTAVFPIPNDPDKGEVTIKHLLPGEVEDIQEEMKVFETVVRPNAEGKMETEMRQNTGLGDNRYLFVVRSITDWKNIKVENADGKFVALNCTDENKVVLARAAEVEVTREDGTTETLSFTAWVNECRVELAKQVREKKEKAEKN